MRFWNYFYQEISLQSWITLKSLGANKPKGLIIMALAKDKDYVMLEPVVLYSSLTPAYDNKIYVCCTAVVFNFL